MSSKIKGRTKPTKRTEQDLLVLRLKTEIGALKTANAKLEMERDEARDVVAAEYGTMITALEGRISDLHESIPNLVDALSKKLRAEMGDTTALVAGASLARVERDRALERLAAATAEASSVREDESGFAERVVKAEAALIEAYDDLKALLRMIKTEGFASTELLRRYRQALTADQFGGEQERKMRVLWRELLSWLSKCERRGYPKLEGVGDTEDAEPVLTDEQQAALAKLRPSDDCDEDAGKHDAALGEAVPAVDDDCDDGRAPCDDGVVCDDEAFTPGAKVAKLFKSLVGKGASSEEPKQEAVADATE
jgi:hypothetical protein